MIAETCNAPQPARDTPTISRLCRECLEERPIGEFRRRGRNSDRRHSVCRPCRNRLDRERRFLAKANRERRRLGAWLTAIRAARSERELAYFVGVALRQFGGISGFARVFGAYHRHALEEFGRGHDAPLFRSVGALLECMRFVDDVSRKALPGLSDDEIREQRDRALLELVRANPESVADLLRSRGYTVERTFAGEVDSCADEHPTRTGV